MSKPISAYWSYVNVPWYFRSLAHFRLLWKRGLVCREKPMTPCDLLSKPARDLVLLSSVVVCQSLWLHKDCTKMGCVFFSSFSNLNSHITVWQDGPARWSNWGEVLVEIKCVCDRRNTTVFSNCWRNQLHVSSLFWVGHYQVETRMFEKTYKRQRGLYIKSGGNEISFYSCWGDA
jgi:hypothetical protein